MKKSVRVSAVCLLVLSGCATTEDRVTRSARAPRGRVGFGVSSVTQREFGGSIAAFRTGLAAASAPGVEPGGGDFLWRITSAGTSLEICHAGWAQRSCRTALFDGAPNPLAPMIKFSVYPVLIDPINLGRVGLVSTDAKGNVWVYNNLALDIKRSTVPVTPGYGVWALGGGSTLHHCQLEGETPRCRAAKLPDGNPVAGFPISVKTYGGAEPREGVWMVGMSSPLGAAPNAVGVLAANALMHCEARSGAMEAPACRPAKLGAEAVVIPYLDIGRFVLASHGVEGAKGHGHVLWAQLEKEGIVRCQSIAGESPGCARAQIK